MNKETKTFKKVIKTRKKRTIKKRMLEQERQQRKGSLSIARAIYLKYKKERSEKIKEERQKRIKQLREIFKIPENEQITLEALEELYKVASKESEKNKK